MAGGIRIFLETAPLDQTEWMQWMFCELQTIE